MSLTITSGNGSIILTYVGRKVSIKVNQIKDIILTGNIVSIIHDYVYDPETYNTNRIDIDYTEVTSPTYTSGEELHAALEATYLEQIQVSSGSFSESTPVETLVTAQALTASYADFGAEIDMDGYNRLGIWVTADVNDSLNVTLKILAKYTSAGADEYEVDGVDTKTLWTSTVADFKKYYEVEVGTVSIIQLQAIAVTVGATAGTLTIGITKRWVGGR